jgi:peptidoglycan hydrolase CwlO-like protein
MSQNLQLVLTVSGVITTLAAFVGAVYVAIRSQSGRMKDDVIKAQESLLEAERQERRNLEHRITVLEAQVTTMTREFAVVVAGAVVAALHESWPGLDPPAPR